MKKIFTTVIITIVSLISINMWGQITYSKPESKPYERIGYKRGLYHYFSSDKYEYTVFSSNQYEDYQINLNLGKGKEQAITSLENIIQMWNDANHGDRVLIGGYYFTVIKNCMVEIEYDYYYEGFWQTYYNHAGVYHMDIRDIKYFLEFLTEPTIQTSDDDQTSNDDQESEYENLKKQYSEKRQYLKQNKGKLSDTEVDSIKAEMKTIMRKIWEIENTFDTSNEN